MRQHHSRPFRLSPLWWPALLATAPAVGPLLLLRHRRHLRRREKVRRANAERLERCSPLELPDLEALTITPLVEQQAAEGYLGAPGVSYHLSSEEGDLLFDVGFGPEHPSLLHNARALELDLSQVQALTISHCHLDHMGGRIAAKTKTVAIPHGFELPAGIPCFLPDKGHAPGFEAQQVQSPHLLPAGMATTGPLARSLFFMGWTEEQALLARLRNKGLVLVTGCGHPTLKLLLQMVRQICPDEPLHAVVGGLHLPLTASRFTKAGVQLQMFFGTGKPPWQRINEQDLADTIAAINESGARRLLLSAHDTCSNAISALEFGTSTRCEVLEVGRRYTL